MAASGSHTRAMPVDFTLRLPDGAQLDVRAPAGASLGAVLGDLGGPLAGAPCWSGTRRLADGEAVGQPGLRAGDIVSVGAPGARADDRGSVLQLHGVGGPAGGAIIALRAGLHIIGRGPGVDLALPDPDVSRRHASLTVTPGGVTVHDLGSANGTYVDDLPVTEDGAELVAGQQLRCGSCVLALAALPDPPAAERVDEAVRLITRPPRLPAAPTEVVIDFPARPMPAIPLRVQWAATVVGAAGAAVLALVLRSPIFLAFAALGPLTMLATAVSDRWSARRGRRTARRAFGRSEQDAERRLAQALAEDLAQLRLDHPDPAAVRLVAAPSTRIWERRRGDADLLIVRVGLGRRVAGPRPRRDGDDPPPREHGSAPIALDLRHGPVGVAGAGSPALGVLRAMTAQLAVLHAPGDVRVLCATADSRGERWRWLRWLPHLDRAADDAAGRRALVTDLASEIAVRRAGRRPGEVWTGSWIVAVIDGAAGAPEMAAVPALLREGRDVGVTALWLEDAAHVLPESCAAVVDASAGPTGDVAVAGEAGPGAVLLDTMPLAAADGVARALSGLRLPADADQQIPSAVRLLDLLDLPDVDAPAVRRRWATAGELCAPIGAGAHGPVRLDLEHDGPHALIAGTTGSGKSELLQSIVAGLAATRSPADLAFVLIDYKGGATFGACSRLPHVSGVVTDLDARLAERALRSLTAELRRRERLLAAAGAKDIAAYRQRRAGDAMPSLVLLVDEFAALAHELPQFLSGLVAVAARGRSLGVHLVLATQRPGGAVSPDIRANTALRIALRVTDPNESLDVIGTAAAAQISGDDPGRGYLSRAGSGAPIAFQAARVVGVRASAGAATAHVLDRWVRGPARPAPPAADGRPDDLGVLVEAIRAAAPPGRPAPPWLPPLPPQLPETDSRLTVEPGRVALGLLDRPDDQAQPPLELDLAAGGMTLIAGAARSGRTAALRTVAAAALRGPIGPDLYIVDGTGSGGLQAAAAAPACAAMLDGDDPAALAALVRRLAARPSAGAPGQDSPRPAVLLIDGIEAILATLEEADPGAGGDALLGLLRRSASIGVTVVAAGDRTALIGRISTAAARRIVLRMDDPADYALAGIPARLAPAAIAPGRGLLAPDGIEVQIAALADGSAGGQAAELARIADAAAPPGPEPRQRIRALPRVVSSRDLLCGPGLRPDDVALGVGGDDAAPIRMPLLAAGARFLVAGPPGSGRTTALSLIAAQARAAGRLVVQIDAAAIDTAGTAEGALDPLDALDSAAGLDGPGPAPVLIIDNCERLGSTPLGDRLARWAGETSAPLAMIVAGNSLDPALSYRGLGLAVARGRSGVLLQPGPRDGELLGITLPRLREPRRPGRGVLVAGDQAIAVQVARP